MFVQIQIEQLPFDAADFRHAGQEDQETARVLRQRAADNFSDCAIKMAGEGLIEITGLDRKHPAFAGNHRRIAQE